MYSRKAHISQLEESIDALRTDSRETTRLLMQSERRLKAAYVDNGALLDELKESEQDRLMLTSIIRHTDPSFGEGGG